MSNIYGTCVQCDCQGRLFRNRTGYTMYMQRYRGWCYGCINAHRRMINRGDGRTPNRFYIGWDGVEYQQPN